VIKISRLSDYAVVILTSLAEQEGGALLTANALSERTRLPEPTVAKVLKRLAKGDLIKSIRGASGGYKLTQSPSRINVADITQAMEGPVSLTACVEGSHEVCDFRKHCSMNGRWDGVNMAIRIALESITLADMVPARATQTFLKKENIHERI